MNPRVTPLVESKNSSWNKGIHPVELELLTNRRPIDVPMEDEKPLELELLTNRRPIDVPMEDEKPRAERDTGGVALAFAAGV